jgi:SAM-dependent methyltransferase
MSDTLKSALVSAVGWPIPLLHGDTGVLDRWLWLRDRLPRSSGAKLLDVGCGSGAFTIGAALRGYDALGLSWDERNNGVAIARAAMCKAGTARFEAWDVRRLAERADFAETFDVVMMVEVIEHVLDDARLLRSAAGCLKPGGRLLLTTPNIDFKAIIPSNDGPFSTTEDGGHVRKGYGEDELRRLAAEASLDVDGVSFCMGVLSQKITSLFHAFSRIHPLLGSAMITPLRVVPPIMDAAVTRAIGYPEFSICLEARKPLRATT